MSGGDLEQIHLDAYQKAVISAWFLMDGNPRVEAVNDVCELLGWEDPTSLLEGLLTMREQKRQEQEQAMVTSRKRR